MLEKVEEGRRKVGEGLGNLKSRKLPLIRCLKTQDVLNHSQESSRESSREVFLTFDVRSLSWEVLLGTFWGPSRDILGSRLGRLFVWHSWVFQAQELLAN